MELWELLAREGLRDLVARYAHAADKGRFDELAALFTDSGVLDIGGGRVMRGREAIRTFLNQQKTDVAAKTGATLVRHHVTNLRLDVDDARTARGVAYFLVVTDRGVDHWGQYRDRYLLDADRWRFAERTVKLEGHSATGWAAANRREPS